jgi:UDP:flavonoid glycosyltransferase YjiC (YdhE family)
MVSLHSAPLRRTSGYAHPLVTNRRLPATMNALTGSLFERVWARGMRREVDAFRSDVGLPPVRGTLPARQASAGALELQTYDEALVPDTRWDDRRPLVGFLTLDDELRSALGETGVDDELDAWLEAGDPPVFFGFGSMPLLDPAATSAMIGEVACALGVRALVSAGWGRLATVDVDDSWVKVVGAVDHEAVLPRCCAAVHHGGAGTTAASLGAGVPTVVCSVFADQPFWGARVADQGVGATLRFTDLGEASLAAALRTALDDDVRRRAAEMARRLTPGSAAARRAADLVESVA